MSVIASDIVVYGSANMAENETTLDIGGAIDLLTLIVFTDIDTPGTVEVVSGSAGDTTPQMTVTGRDGAGALLSEQVTLTGVSPVAFSNTYERFLKFELDIAAAGIVTVRKTGNAGDLAIFPVSVTTVRQPFYNASADVTGGAARTFYEKIFIKNENGSTALTEAQIVEQADSGSNVEFDLESTLDGSDSNGGANNRQVAPGGYTFDSATKNVVNSQNHNPGTAQGCWLKLSLAAGAAPAKNTYTIRETGKTT